MGYHAERGNAFDIIVIAIIVGIIIIVMINNFGVIIEVSFQQRSVSDGNNTSEADEQQLQFNRISLRSGNTMQKRQRYDSPIQII